MQAVAELPLQGEPPIFIQTGTNSSCFFTSLICRIKGNLDFFEWKRSGPQLSTHYHVFCTFSLDLLQKLEKVALGAADLPGLHPAEGVNPNRIT